jgi:hypothetical protein
MNPNAFTLTRRDAMAYLDITDPRIFRRDVATQVESRARTAKCPRQRMYRRSDLDRLREGWGADSVPTPPLRLMTAKQLAEKRRQRRESWKDGRSRVAV